MQVSLKLQMWHYESLLGFQQTLQVLSLWLNVMMASLQKL